VKALANRDSGICGREAAVSQTSRLTTLDAARQTPTRNTLSTPDRSEAANMMRQQLVRSLRRSQRLPAVTNVANNARAFSTTGQRNAEVELTIDGKKVSIEGTTIRSLKIRKYYVVGIPWRLTGRSISWICAHSSMREGRSHHSSILLPRKAHDCRKLQNVFGRGRTRTQAGRIVCLACSARHGCEDRQPVGSQSKRRCNGVLAGESPAGLPYLRPGR
jgi:hypothetical protein